MRDLEAGLYHVCDACGGTCEGCRVCWDQGLLPHDCRPNDPTPDDPPVEDESDHA